MTYAMSLLGGKWRAYIIHRLRHKDAVRFGELKRSIPGVTNNVLSTALKELEAAGIVTRIQYDEMPVRVEYQLTDSLDGLYDAIEVITAWGEQFVDMKPGSDSTLRE